MTKAHPENEVVLLRGLPGSGKTTFAHKWVAENPSWRVRVNKEDLAAQLYKRPYGLLQEQSETVATFEHAQVHAALKGNRSVVIDDLNLDAQTVKEWYSLAEKYKVPLRVVDFESPLEDCIRRDACRVDYRGEDVVRDLYKRYTTKGKLPKLPEKPSAESVQGSIYVPDESLPKAYVFDIDGTLARMSGRSPFAYEKVGEDELIANVAGVMDTLYDAGNKIIVMSGREDWCRPQTEEWLQRHNLDYDELHMRPTLPKGSQQPPDDLVKLELFDKHVRYRFNVVGVFDDRLRVCRMWESIGLTLFRVGPLDSDF